MGVLDKAKAHLAAQKPRRLPVPEWGVTVTWTPMLLVERKRIYAELDDGGRPDGATIQMRAVIIKACDDKGKKLFDAMDEHALLTEVDGDVLGRIATAILHGLGADIDRQVDTEKNG